MNPRPRQITRRRFVAESAAAVGAVSAAKLGNEFARAAEATPAYQATGVKVGEVTDSSAIVWTRLTAAPARNAKGVDLQGRVQKGVPKPVPVPVAQLEGACPGAPGRMRVRYGT